MIKNVIAFALVTMLSTSAFAQLPCGEVTSIPQKVTVDLNDLDPVGAVTGLRIFRASSPNSVGSVTSFPLPAPNEDGTYTVTVSGAGFNNNLTYYVWAVATGPTGASNRSNVVEVPATISGACPPPHEPLLVSVVAL